MKQKKKKVRIETKPRVPERTRQFVAVVKRADYEDSLREDGSWICFVALTKKGAVEKARKAMISWKLKEPEKYSIEVGELTESAAVRVHISYKKL